MTKFKEHNIWWDEGNEIVKAVGIGPADEEAARWILDETKRLAQEHGDGLDWMLDLSEITKTTAKARKLLAEASGHPSIRKYAMVGGSTFIRTVSNFIIVAAGQKNARHFATEEEALVWIKEGEK